ncbi:glutamate receptor 2.9-like [Humulus lupulus]|uniref:glutamate receptor 2.9-like n=1 Tax=Humulus lupulus TaxID=3486 RepID=UPI002B416152|nr:glutamate receptor 2.9-like [Humulus lupulus]
MVFGFIFPTLGDMFQLVLFSCLLVNYSYGETQVSNTKKIMKVGAIIDTNSRIGKQQRAAMEIAAQNFNNSSTNRKLSLYFKDSRRESSASSAKQMIEEDKVEVIVGMETWHEAALVGKVGNETQVPVISLAGPTIKPPLMQLRWPFLITMADDASTEINCIVDLVKAYNWQKVIVIYEEDEYGGGEYGAVALLNEALRNIGSEIEYRLFLPPYSSLSDPKMFVQEKLKKLSFSQSRAFIVLRSSLPMVTHLFGEAKKEKLLETDSAWIITESVTSLLDSVDSTVISSMKGIIGIKTYYSKSTISYKAFHSKFQQTFSENNPQEGNLNPGYKALQAYDSIQVITQAMEKMASNFSGKLLMENMSSANFDGLSGQISFTEGKFQHNPIFRIVNVVDNGGKELDFWQPNFGFSKCLVIEEDKLENRLAEVCKSSQGLSGSVVWPGNLVHRTPHGWAMPTCDKPLQIVVPIHTQFKKFVTVNESNKNSKDGYDGFSIQILKNVTSHLKSNYNLSLEYKFVALDVSAHDELIEAVYNKKYDAIAADVTILAKRMKSVDFTQPYAESGLSMVVPKPKESASMFIKPFTWDMWMASGAIFVYTMFIVWFLEHPTNPEFRGTLKNQLGTSISFTVSSLFFAQKEKVYSNITRVVVTMWLLAVFILTASYTASLSSILTIRQLKPDIDIEWLQKNNKTVGCGDVFVCEYVKNVLGFKQEKIESKISDEDDYLKHFKENSIAAAFLEVPYEKVFLNKYCKGYTTTPSNYRFGGLAFAFQKGSPIARIVSKAILELIENGSIGQLERKTLTPLEECSSTSSTNKETDQSLSTKSFWGIYLMSGATSTICFLLALIRRLKNSQPHHNPNKLVMTHKV